MKVVKFVEPHTPYAVDDIASFDDKTAEKLIKAEVAVPYEVKEEKKEPEKTETKSVKAAPENKMVTNPPVEK